MGLLAPRLLTVPTEVVVPLPFDPASLSGMVLWLVAEDLALTDNDPIGTWTDASTASNDATQATGGAKPTFKTAIVNGLAVARFDGGDYLDSALPMDGTSRTMFAVLQPTGTGYRTIVGSNGGNQGLQWRLDDTTNYQTLNRQYLDGVGTSTAAVTSAFHVVSFTYVDATSYAFELDGVASGSGSHSRTLASARTAAIGRNPSVPGEYFTGDVAELIAYDGVLSSGDIADVTAYLQAKYAL